MSGVQQMMISRGGAKPDVIYVVTTSGTGSYTAPAGYTKVTVEAIGGGGDGFGSTTTNQRAGGGGGQYAISNANIAVTPGVTVVYYSVGAGITRSWVNVGTNSQPASATVGCVAMNGSSGTSGTAGLGNIAGSVGATTRVGGNGTTGSTGRGGGGAGASTAGSGFTAGTDTTGLSPSNLMGGGTGGTSGGGVGTAPGGGGGGKTTAGAVAGAVGRVRIRFRA